MSNGRLSANDVELIYPSNNGQRCEWFGIKQDKQTKQIRILYNTIDDVYFDVVHEVKVNGRNRVISCLNSRGQNVNDCPMCRAGYQQKVLLYVPVLDLSDNKIKIWTRSKGFLPTIQGLMMRNNPLSGTVFEVMRNGEKGSPTTTYLFQPISVNDGQTVESLLAQYQLTLPEQTSYMDVYDTNQMQVYVNNLESIQGNIPVNRSQGQLNYQPYYNNQSQYQQFAQNPQYTPVQPSQTAAPIPNQGYTVSSAPAPAPTQPMTPPTNVPGAYQPAPVPQAPMNTPVRRPATPPAPPTPPNVAPPSNEFISANSVDPDDLPF